MHALLSPSCLSANRGRLIWATSEGSANLTLLTWTSNESRLVPAAYSAMPYHHLTPLAQLANHSRSGCDSSRMFAPSVCEPTQSMNSHCYMVRVGCLPGSVRSHGAVSHRLDFRRHGLACHFETCCQRPCRNRASETICVTLGTTFKTWPCITRLPS